MSFQPSPKFQDAAAHLSSASSLSQVSSSIKLELYGLYKYLTVSRNPNISRPSVFDMTGRAKWDAWNAAGIKYSAAQDAESRYLEIARSLGWSEFMEKEERSPSESAMEVDLEHLSDEEDVPPPQSSSAGLGRFVSRMIGPEIVADKSLHDLVLSCDVAGIVSLLDKSAEFDLNALDEYGYAPIHLACDRGHLEVVRLLLSRGAKRDIKDPDNLTPLELSQEAGHTEVVKLLGAYS